MNFVPWAFIDAVMAQIDQTDMTNLQQLSRNWSSTATTHLARRRNLSVNMAADPGMSEVRIQLVSNGRFVPYEMNPTYDLVSLIAVLSYAELSRISSNAAAFSLDHFRKQIVPALRNQAKECYITMRKPCSTELMNMMQKEFRDWRGIAGLAVDDTSPKGVDFLKRQFSFGNLKLLNLACGRIWPTEIQDLISVFVGSKHFKWLEISGSNLRLDFEMVETFLNRFFAGNFSKGPTRIVGDISFPKEEFKKLYRKNVMFSHRWPVSGTNAVWTRHDRRRMEAYNYTNFTVLVHVL